MAFLDKTGLQALTNRLVQGDAIKVASHRGRTIENVIDNITRECGNVPTPLEYKIENRVTDFRVGQGRDVDASGDVEKGYTEIELQGKTWQNLLELEKHQPLYGQTTVIGSAIKYVCTQTHNAAHRIQWSVENMPLLKENTDYTLSFVITVNKKRTVRIGGFLTDKVYKTLENCTEHIVMKVRTVSKKEAPMYLYFNPPENDKELYLGDEVIIDSLIMTEGDHTQTPIEELPQYFEGIQSSFEDGVIDIDVVGKNLFKYEDVVKRTPNSIVEVGDDYVSITDEYYCGSMVKIDKNTRYYVSAIRQPIGDSNGGSISIFKSDGTGVQGATPIRALGKDNGYFDSGENEYISVLLYGGSAKRGTCIFRNVQIEKAGKITSYEPYYKKKISFNIDEPLRSLPNGVCDEISGGNLIRRVGKVVLDGSESWFSIKENESLLRIGVAFQPKPHTKVLSTVNKCDTLPAISMVTVAQLAEEGIATHNVDKQLTAIIAKSKLQTPDVTGFKKWLQANPTTVYYELETPVITPIDPIKFETQPLGSIEINSEISPTSFHTVQLNRAAQIERGITEIAELKNRVEILETIYDSHFLETAHKLELLGMDYELESEVI